MWVAFFSLRACERQLVVAHSAKDFLGCLPPPPPQLSSDDSLAISSFHEMPNSLRPKTPINKQTNETLNFLACIRSMWFCSSSGRHCLFSFPLTNYFSVCWADRISLIIALPLCLFCLASVIVLFHVTLRTWWLLIAVSSRLLFVSC